MSAKYDLKHKKNPKVLRPKIRKNYDVKKSAYSWRSGGGRWRRSAGTDDLEHRLPEACCVVV